LPEDFDPIARAGLGMGIIQALVRQIGGELRWGRGAGDKGACFTVMFS
jgi:two-component sensor histidine kinase